MNGRPATIQSSTIERIGRAGFVFSVPSESKRGESYMVDLAANDLLGSCNCKDFRTRRWVRIRDGEKCASGCKHIKAARDHLLKCVITGVPF